MANVEIFNNLESAGRVTPEKATKPETVPNFQSDDSFPNLLKKGGASKRKKSISSPPGDHPNKKKGNKSTNQHEAAASSSREAGDTQQEREVEGSEAKGS